MTRLSGPNTTGRGSNERRRRGDIRRLIQDIMLAFLVVVAVFGLALWESRAHAAVQSPAFTATSPASQIVLARLSNPDVWQPLLKMPSFDAPVFVDRSDFLGIDQLENARLSNDRIVSSHQRVSEFAMEDQVFWRHAGRKADQLPWFVAGQKKKHAGMTGRAQFLMLAIVFAAMAALTMGFWRQFGGVAGNNRSGKSPARRLQ